jgi:sec-independent protein translocase protein TatA
MDLSLPHILVLLLIIVILFGGRRIPELMRGLGEGVRNFKEGMRTDQPSQTGQPPAPTPPTEEKK